MTVRDFLSILSQNKNLDAELWIGTYNSSEDFQESNVIRTDFTQRGRVCIYGSNKSHGGYVVNPRTNSIFSD